MRFGLAIVAFLSLLGTHAFSKNSSHLKEWTILVYSAADEGSKERESDFADSATRVLKGFENIEALRAKEEVAIVLQYDASGDDTDDVMRNKKWRRRFEYLPQTPKGILGSAGIDEKKIREIDPTFVYDELDSSDPVPLKKFINWAIQAYPAKHYFLILQGHSWGKLGMMMDFHVDGKDLETANLMKNYELRRVMEEVYREDATRAVPLIPHGKFDGVLVDACVSGQLDELLEWKNSFDYFVGTSLEIPFNSLPYADIFDPFLKKVVARARAGKDAGDRQFIEQELIKPMVTKTVESHGPGGNMAVAERQADIVQMFAIRLRNLDPVFKAFKNFVREMPEQARKALRKMSPQAVWAIRDTDENADLRNLARAYRNSYAGKLNKYGGDEWARAEKSAAALEASLGYQAPNPSTELTRITHPKAVGAWVHVPLDTIAPNRELPACFVLRTFAMHNWREKNLLPNALTKKDKEQPFRETACNDELTAAGGKISGPKNPRAGVPFPLEKVLGWKLSWEHGVRTFLTEKENGDRRLSFWVPKLKTKPLDYRLALHFYAANGVQIEYVSGDAEAYLMRKKGFEDQLLSREEVRYEHSVYVSSGKDLVTAPGASEPLYVAEAHSNGAHFKEGFGIFLGLKFDPEEAYQNGRLPLEVVEKQLGFAPFELTLEKFKAEERKIEALLQKSPKATDLVVRGGPFYRLHKIALTGWADLLGAKKE